MDKQTRSGLRLAKQSWDRLFARSVAAHFDRLPGRKGRSGKKSAVAPINILAVGIGEKLSDGKHTGVFAVSVHVRRKLPASGLAKSWRIPATIAGLPTDVLEVEGVRALAAAPPSLQSCLANPAMRQPRPFPAGVSVGGDRNPPGTIGYVVRGTTDGKIYLLSNYHVLGDHLDADRRPITFQPGFGDGMNPDTDQVGEMTRGVPLNLVGGVNLLDAAVAEVQPGVTLPFLCAFGPIRGGAVAAHDDVVSFYGRSSRFSKGIVKDIEVNVVVDYPNDQEALFANQIYIRPLGSQPFAQSGDSGALVVKGESEKRACALLFAAELRNGGGYATPILRVLRALQVAIA